MKKSSVNQVLALEAKMIVALAFRNGPIEDLHAGKVCPTCSADGAYSRISDEEMKGIMKAAVNTVYSLLWKRENDTPSAGTTPSNNNPSHSFILTGR